MDGFVSIPLPAQTTPKREASAAEAARAPGADDAVTDEVLLERISAGEQNALALLFRRYAVQIRRIAYRVLRDASEADDIVQDVFLLIHRNSSGFDPAKGPARSRILHITYQKAISRRRYLDCRHFYSRLDFEEVGDDISAPAAYTRMGDPIAEALGSGVLEKMFQNLSEDQQLTLRLFFLQGYTLDEIASELGQSRENVRHHYFRGLERLRKQIFRGGAQPK